MSSTTPTPAAVSQNATQTEAANLRAPLLLGLVGPEDALAALVRLPGGKVQKLGLGDKLASARVVGIDAKGLVLEKGGKTERLDLGGI